MTYLSGSVNRWGFSKLHTIYLSAITAVPRRGNTLRFFSGGVCLVLAIHEPYQNLAASENWNSFALYSKFGLSLENWPCLCTLGYRS
jgi:hypothetical protein